MTKKNEPHDNINSLSKLIVDFINRDDQGVLFAGAGVSSRAGLPGWKSYMEQLARIAENYNEIQAAAVQDHVNKGHYLEAAETFKLIPEIPIGETYRHLSEPFQNPPEWQELRALMSLPFTAVVTTNYDRALHDAWSSVLGRAPHTVENSDNLSKASYWRQFFIARIHGRCEDPGSMVVSRSDYSRTEKEDYLEFVTNCLTRYRCLFLGFSFLDPAIRRILGIIEDRLSPNFPKLHLAIIPEGTNVDFISELRRFNIQVEEYVAGFNHDMLWDSVEEASRLIPDERKQQRPPSPIPLQTTQRFIASAYARLKLSPNVKPLRDTVADAILTQLLSQAADRSLTLNQLTEVLRATLALPPEDAQQLIQRRIRHLEIEGICSLEDDLVCLQQDIPNSLEGDLQIVVKGVSSRLLVRHNIEADSTLQEAISETAEEILLTRGWDLGASYLASDDIEQSDLLATIREIVSIRLPDIPDDKKEKVSLAHLDLFLKPDEVESEVLANLGRASFALNMAFQLPSSTLINKAIFPDIIYLDSNVLMRAIVQGHPLRPVYVDSLRRIREASQELSSPVSVQVLPGFLEEVLRHRELAIREVMELGLEDFEELKSHVRYFGLSNLNIYIAAYSTRVGRLNEGLPFQEFLSEAAPYSSVEELRSYLKSLGILVLNDSRKDIGEYYHPMYLALKDAYDKDTPDWHEPKEDVLIRNEARQLAHISMDLATNIHSVFVTGDMRLRRLCVGPELGPAGTTIMSNQQFVQFVDLIVGLETDSASMARLLWGSPISEEGIALRDYFTDIALEYLHDARTQTIPELIDNLVAEVTEAAEAESIELFSEGSVEEKAIQARFLDRFEKGFYEDLASIRKQLDEQG